MSKTIAAGTIVMLNHHGYGDAFTLGVYRALVDIDTQAVQQSFLVDLARTPPNPEDAYIGCDDRFTGSLLRSGMLAKVECARWEVCATYSDLTFNFYIPTTLTREKL